MSAEVQCLSDLKPGQTGIIQQLLGNDDTHLRLMELGMLPGTMVRCLRAAPFGDPLEVEVRGYNLSLRREEAASISIALS